MGLFTCNSRICKLCSRMPKIVESIFTKNFLLIIFVKICLLLMNYILKVKVLFARSCPTLCDLMDYSPPGSSVLGILQAKILEWVAISFSGTSSIPRNWTQVFHIAGRFFIIWANNSGSALFTAAFHCQWMVCVRAQLEKEALSVCRQLLRTFSRFRAWPVSCPCGRGPHRSFYLWPLCWPWKQGHS